MNRRTIFLLLAIATMGCGVVIAVLVETQSEPPAPLPDYSDRIPVALNRGSEVMEGFQGDIHPVLNGHSALDLTAKWDYERNQEGARGFLQVPPKISEIFMGLVVNIPSKTYSEQDFSRFLPEKEIGAVGQTWAVDLEKAAELLKQFHPAPSMRLIAKGRRAGPDGGFAVLRAVSPTHYDILLRIHAEFDVVQNPEQRKTLVSEAWYSPGCFLGRMVINRTTGTVEYFSLGVPPDKENNVHVSVATIPVGESHGWMRVDTMELTGGNKASVEKIRWVDQIDPADAYERLAKIFYKYKEIDWVDFGKAQEIARAKGKPLFVVVALGALDNQTC